jgi:flagellar motor switch/type III secretory pathway protein FliN
MAPPRVAAPIADGENASAGQALVPAPRTSEELEESAFSPRVLRLPVELDVTVPVGDFRVRHLLALAPEQLIESQWASGRDLPLAAGDVRLAWAEFEVVESKLAVRVTRVQ